VPELSPSLETEIGTAQPYGWNYSTSSYPIDLTEQNAATAWPASVATYDLMSKDAQVASLYRAVTLPIRQAQWSIDPNGASDEVTAFVADDLGLPILGAAPTTRRRAKGRFSWPDHLRQALLSLRYGFMPFEQTYQIVGSGPNARAHLSKLGPRMPQTISKISSDAGGGLASVTQTIAGQKGGAPEDIGVDRLVFYCHEREGAAWQGVSLFRPMYREWLLKDRLIRVNAMTLERNGMGIPIIEAPPGAIKADMDMLAKLAQEWRAGDKAGGSIPHGTKLALKGVEGHLPDILAALQYHDAAMSKLVHAQFLELGGQKTSGNRALAGVFRDFFDLGLDAIGQGIADVGTDHIVEDIVDLNFGEDTPSPRLMVAQVAIDEDLTPEQAVALSEAGILTADDDLEAYFRTRYRLPRRPDGEPRPVQRLGGGTTPLVAARQGRTASHRVTAAAAGDGGEAGDDLPEPLGTLYRRRHALEVAQNTSLAAVLPVWRASVDLTAVLAATGIVQADSVQPSSPDPRALAAEVAAEQALTSSLTTNAGQALRDTAHTGLVQSYAEGQAGARQLVSVTTGQIGVDLAAMSVDFADAVAAADNLDSLWTEADAWLAEHVGVVSRALGDAVGQALTDGTGRDELLSSLEGVIEDGTLAEVLYDHAMATALGQGAADLYQSENVASVDWSTAGDSRVDQVCETYETNSPYALADAPSVPAHVGCRCNIQPADDAIRALLAPASDGLSAE